MYFSPTHRTLGYINGKIHRKFDGSNAAPFHSFSFKLINALCPTTG